MISEETRKPQAKQKEGKHLFRGDKITVKQPKLTIKMADCTERMAAITQSQH